MDKLIEYNDHIIGYKNDLIKYMESEATRLRNDENISNEELAVYLTENKEVIEKLNEYNNFYLLAIGEGVMGELTVKHVGIEMEKEK